MSTTISRTRVLTLGVLAAAMALPGAAPAASLVDRLPREAAALGRIDLAAIRRSTVVDPKRFDEEPLPEAAGAWEGFLRQAGLDVRKDLDEIAFALVPRAAAQESGPGGAQGDFAALARGRFDVLRVKQAAIAHGAKAVKLADVAALRLPSDGSDEPVYMSFLDGLMVLGSEGGTQLVHAATAAGPAPVRDRSARDVPADAAAWIVADVQRFESAGEANPALAMAGKLHALALWGTFTDVVKLEAVADAADAQVAVQLAGVAQILAGAPAAAPLLASLKVSAEGARIRASLTLTKEQLEAMSGEKDGTASGVTGAASGT